MAFNIGINFRATAGYVTDPANCTYSLDETYPVTRGGVTFGWVDAAGGNGRNRNNFIDPRLAGICYRNDSSATKSRFRLDLPASGLIDVYCAAGDSGNGAYLEIFDNTTSLATLIPNRTGVASNTYYDAANAAYSAANWPGSNAKSTLTFATTTLIAKITPGLSSGANYVINHLRAVQGDSGITLIGANSTEANTSSTAAITQVHSLGGAASAQANAGSIGAITPGSGSVNDLTGAASIQGHAISADAIMQTHVMTASTSTQNGTSSAIAITKVHVLAATASAQGNLAGIDAITLGSGDLAGAPSIQGNISASVAISVTRTLTAAASTQANLSGSGAISDGIVVEAALTTGIAETVRIKKPGIPAGTPEWLKTMLEILTGRRGNRIEAPQFQALTFSAMPTRAECEALYRYTNTVRDSLEQLLSRMDG